MAEPETEHIQIESNVREQTHERLTRIEASLVHGSERMDRIERSLNENTDLTAEVREIMVAGKGAFKVLGWLGVVAKWVAAIVGGVMAVVALFHLGQHK